MDLVFKDIDVQINKTPILKKICGMVKQGEMLAVIGPSGAGKSTLLNALAGHSLIESGQITLNNQPLTKQLKRKVAYVLQEDVFFPNLTLRETLTYSAYLRLPDKMSTSLKVQRVDEILDVLRLTKCADTVMGSATVQGLSGGEKKRASIAMELLTNPLVLLIDEPTSGLDYATAYSLMQIMSDYTEKTHKTVVVTIHQPSSQIFHMFHNLLLLVDGEVGYFGEAPKVLDFFSGLGLHCMQHYNPADFIVEKVKQNADVTQAIINKSRKARKTDWPRELRSVYIKPEQPNSIGFSRLFTQGVSLEPGGVGIKGSNYQKKSLHSSGTSLDSGISTTDKIPEDASEVVVVGSIVETDLQVEEFLDRDCKWPTGFWTQYTVLVVRIMKQARHRILANINLAQAIIITVFGSLIWFQTERSEETLRDRMGILFFSSVYWGFVSLLEAINAFPEELPVINRERAAGIYRLSAYYMAKMTSELPLTLIQPMGYITILYWCSGLTYSAASFFSCMFTMLFFTIAFQGFGMFLSCSILDYKKCLIFGSVFMLISMLAGGFYQRHIPSWAIWLKYLSICNYVFHALMHIEFAYGEPLKCLPSNQTYFSSCHDINITMVTGTEILETYDITWPLWMYYVALAIFTIVTRALGYIILRFVNKPPGIK